MANDGTIARRLLISGRVQGVFYRDWTVRAAMAAGVSGWIRNLADGRVETWLEGEGEAVDAMIARCREGPERAEVTAIAVEEVAAEDIEGFARR